MFWAEVQWEPKQGSENLGTSLGRGTITCGQLVRCEEGDGQRVGLERF